MMRRRLQRCAFIQLEL